MRVVIAVDNEPCFDAGRPILPIPCDALPADLLEVDEHGGEGNGVAVALGVIQHFELSVVLVNEHELGDAFGEPSDDR